MFELVNACGCNLGVIAEDIEELRSWLRSADLEPGDKILVVDGYDKD